MDGGNAAEKVEKIDYSKALEQIEDAVWYLSRALDTDDEDCQKVLEGLKQVDNALSDCRNELCSRCGRHIDAHLGACDKCRWR